MAQPLMYNGFQMMVRDPQGHVYPAQNQLYPPGWNRVILQGGQYQSVEHLINPLQYAAPPQYAPPQYAPPQYAPPPYDPGAAPDPSAGGPPEPVRTRSCIQIDGGEFGRGLVSLVFAAGAAYACFYLLPTGFELIEMSPHTFDIFLGYSCLYMGLIASIVSIGNLFVAFSRPEDLTVTQQAGYSVGLPIVLIPHMISFSIKYGLITAMLKGCARRN